MLQLALDQKKWVAHDRDAIFCEHVGRNDGVRNPRFIFNAQKDEALRRAWPLPSAMMAHAMRKRIPFGRCSSSDVPRTPNFVIAARQ